MINPTFNYRVDALGGVHTDGVDGSTWTTARVHVDGLQSPHGWLGYFAQPERDLLRVAAAVLALDRLSLRRPLNTKGTKRELHWRRGLNAEIAVEDPSRWTAAAADLHALLSFLTDDAWKVSFEQAAPFPEQRALFAPELDGRAEIALFSGGLDSSVGMRARHKATGNTFIAVSAVGNPVRRQAQADALESVADLGVSVRSVSIGHQLRSEWSRSRRSLESTQRTRGLFFLSVGAAVASQLESARFHVYETGIGCLNVPTSAAQLASQGTRSMHPLTLIRFNRLMERVLERPAAVVAPFLFMTKGELCGLVGQDLPALAARCSSCDEGDGHKRNPFEHCGLCTSCMFRRIAIVAATGGTDKTKYRDTPSQRHNSYELAAFEYHLAALSRVSTFEDLTDLDPEVRFALYAPTGREVESGTARSLVVGMYRRYAEQIRSYLAVARPQLQPRPERPAKEAYRDLFAATW